ncbi:uncharacterized protein HaLaN_19606 [Haematococcus lacustris]|uniref:Uncharacterized protein n=1 Tax=Haematococcus lacustris TaxID=44745 RepID=A0A6A0A0F0_HAELA|nr:uncharacterized protein HaLaN_19606 [Haematococcus lacustris]
MKRQTYEEVTRWLDTPVGSCPNIRLLQQRFPGVGIQTLVSIYSQENQYKVIKSAQVHRQRISDYCTRWVLPGPCASCSLHRTPPPLTGMLGMGSPAALPFTGHWSTAWRPMAPAILVAGGQYGMWRARPQHQLLSSSGRSVRDG